MYYLWVIRHLDDEPYITPTFVPEHKWVTDKDAIFFPERGSSMGKTIRLTTAQALLRFLDAQYVELDGQEYKSEWCCQASSATATS